jgi:hypothetical protein
LVKSWRNGKNTRFSVGGCHFQKGEHFKNCLTKIALAYKPLGKKNRPLQPIPATCAASALKVMHAKWAVGSEK